MLVVGQPETKSQFNQYFDLRWRILRAPWQQPRGSEQDELETTSQHVTVRDPDGRLLGVGRLHMNDAHEAQIRYMAAELDCRGQGIGRLLVAELERRGCLCGATEIVLNAREQAVGFYRHLGYRTVGEGPTMFGQIRHIQMKRSL